MPSTRIKKIPYQLVEKGKISSLKKRAEIKEGASLLKQGDVVAFPTETVYGLGADATNSQAVKKIFSAKGRPQDNPLIVHIGSRLQLANMVKGEIPTLADSLIKSFWPGPLTIIFNKSNLIPDRTTAGLETVGIRMPSHPVALALIQKAGCPIAAPSANSSGFPSPTRAKHVYSDLKNRIPYIIDGGHCEVGVESTVLSITGGFPTILRPGGITRQEIERVIDRKVVFSENLKGEGETDREDTIPISPGMKYRHYSPSTSLKLVEPLNPKNIKQICKLIEQLNVEKVALILTEESKELIKRELYKCLNSKEKVKLISMGSKQKPTLIAHDIFAFLRQYDSNEIGLIIVESIPREGLGEAVMNRLHKAATDYIYFN